MVSYDTLLRTFRAELKEQEKYKKDMIIKLAKKLEEEKYPIHEINGRLVFDLQGFIGKSYISQILDKKYKQLDKIHEKEKGEEEEATVMNTNDGQTVVNDPELEREQEAKEEFTNEFNQALNSRAEESKSLNDAVLKELDKELNIRKELEEKLAESISPELFETLQKKLAAQEEIMEWIEENLGSYLRFEKDEEGKIICAEINELMKNEPPKEITIDLRRFGDEIKNSFKRGKYVAKIVQKNGQVKSWT